MKKWYIDKKVISLEEFLKYKEMGAKRPFCSKGVCRLEDGCLEIVRVQITCKRCGKVFLTPFASARTKLYLELCTECTNHYKTSEWNKKRDHSIFSNEEYRRKISEGVKRYYQREGKDASLKRIQKKWENFAKNNITPDFSSQKRFIEGISCDSFAEEVFVKWKLSEGYSVKRCDFFTEYEWKNKVHRYLPDFIIEKNNEVTVVEVKCEYKRNFQKRYEYLEDRVKQGKQLSNNLKTYNIDILSKKIESIQDFCRNKGWKFSLITLDNSTFNMLYNRAKRIRRNEKIKNKENISLQRESI